MASSSFFVNRKIMNTNAKTGFAALGLSEALVDTVTKLGYEEPTPIQREAIPPLLAGPRPARRRPRPGPARRRRSRCRCSSASRIGAGRRTRLPSALVLVPTRELAMQVAEALACLRPRARRRVRRAALRRRSRWATRSRRSAAAPTSSSRRPAARSITCARLDAEARRARRSLVLDEADEMLDMGFADDLEAILSATPPDAPDGALLGDDARDESPRLPSVTCDDPARVMIHATAGRRRRCRGCGRRRIIVPRAHKLAALGRVLDVEQPKSAIVFCRTRIEVEDARGGAERARPPRRGAPRRADPGRQRDRVMQSFRDGKPICSSRRTWPPAASTSSISRTSSTTTCRRRPRPTCIGSDAPAGPAATASPSRWSIRASSGCCGTSSRSRGRGLPSHRRRRSATCARVASNGCARRSASARSPPKRAARRAHLPQPDSTMPDMWWKRLPESSN